MKIYDYQNIGILYVGGSQKNGLENLQNKLRKGLSVATDRTIHPKEIERLERLKKRGKIEDGHIERVRRSQKMRGDGKYDNSAIIFAGGAGFGTKSYEFFDKQLKEINELLAQNNTHVFFVRGNEDDPSYFSEHKLAYSNITLLEDYSLIKFHGFNCLCVGGGISLDRKWKQTQEERYGSKLYWENEAPVFDQTELEKIISENDVACVVTHMPPSFAGINTSTYTKTKWNESDAELVKDVISARFVNDDIYRKLIESDKKPYVWFFDESANTPSTVNFIRFIGMMNNINSIVSMNSIVEESFNVRLGLPRESITSKLLKASAGVSSGHIDASFADTLWYPDGFSGDEDEESVPKDDEFDDFEEPDGVEDIAIGEGLRGQLRVEDFPIPFGEIDRTRVEEAVNRIVHNRADEVVNGVRRG